MFPNSGSGITMSQNKSVWIKLNANRRSVLRLAHTYGYITIHNITPSIFGNFKYAQQVLTKLTKENLLCKETCSLFPTTKGAGMNFYTLNMKGYKALTGSARGFRKKSVPTSTHLLHYYIPNMFLSGIKALFPNSSTLSEREIKENESFYNHYLSTQTTYSPSFAIPDFAFLIKTKNNNKLFLGEVDTETENITSSRYKGKSIEEKFVSFSHYYDNGIYDYFAKLLNVDIYGFTYLHITTGKKDRISKINHVCKRINPDMPILITSANKILPIISYDKNRIAHVDNTPLLDGLWLDVNSQSLQSIRGLL